MYLFENKSYIHERLKDRMESTGAAQHEDTTARIILVIEDDDDIGALIVETIQQETPHRAIRFADGYEAWNLLGYQRLLPDLLILDYNLPTINGIELYDRIHARKEFEHIPALIVSAYPQICKKSGRGTQSPLSGKAVCTR